MTGKLRIELSEFKFTKAGRSGTILRCTLAWKFVGEDAEENPIGLALEGCYFAREESGDLQFYTPMWIFRTGGSKRLCVITQGLRSLLVGMINKSKYAAYIGELVPVGKVTKPDDMPESMGVVE